MTECYECNEKPVAKSFPVCTIRSTPSQPIHCIVWAKSYLFAEVFGTSEEATAELDMNEDSENGKLPPVRFAVVVRAKVIDAVQPAKEIANLKREAEELKNIREKIDSPEFVVRIFDKVFKRDIERLLSMEEMWTTRTPPKPLDHAKVAEAASGLGPEVAAKDQQKWTLAENYAVFADSVERLAKRVVELKASAREGEAPPILSFDKDDEDTLDFVAAGANLRSYIFGIDSRTKFDIKRGCTSFSPLPGSLTVSRDGWEYHSCDCYHECHHRWHVCAPSIQIPQERHQVRQDGKWYRPKHCMSCHPDGLGLHR